MLRNPKVGGSNPPPAKYFLVQNLKTVKMQISQRTKEIQPSATLAVSAKANKLKAMGIDVIGFGAGEPDFDTPEHIKKAAEDALTEGFIRYTAVPGIEELREAISKKFKNENDICYDTDEIIVTPGAKHALYEAILATINPGDEVLIPDPYWVSYVPMVLMAEGKPVFISTKEEDRFRVIPDVIKEEITPKTRAIIINSPNNPTGAVLSKKDLEKIAEICIENDLFIISDEIYEKIIYDEKHHSIGSLGGMKDLTITVNGFSKTYAMTGWRLGYAAAPGEVIKAMIKLQAHSVSCATSFVQKAGVIALEGTQDCAMEMVREFKKRRDVLVEKVNEIEGLSCVEPEGAFYAFINVSDYERDSIKFANYLLDEARVAVVPGIAFGNEGEGFIRLSYATSIQNITEGLDRIKRALKTRNS